MLPSFRLRSPRTVRLTPPASLLAGLAAALTLVSASTASAAAPLPYPQAVAGGEAAARAVLARAGRESCLRGKLTRALLNLSNSCEASGSRTPLCALADKAVVVTPMSLTFMDDTSQQLLDLIRPGDPGQRASARPWPPAEEASPAP